MRVQAVAVASLADRVSLASLADLAGLGPIRAGTKSPLKYFESELKIVFVLFFCFVVLPKGYLPVTSPLTWLRVVLHMAVVV